MKKEKVVGWLLLVFAIFTIAGMVLNSNAYWAIYNYVTLIFSITSGIVLLQQK